MKDEKPEPGPPWQITTCTAPHCTVVIRYRGDLHPTVCKWHQSGRAHQPGAWPPGMPNPECPWPWLTDEERETRCRIPLWQERFRAYPNLYRAWILQSVNDEREVTHES